MLYPLQNIPSTGEAILSYCVFTVGFSKAKELQQAQTAEGESFIFIPCTQQNN